MIQSALICFVLAAAAVSAFPQPDGEDVFALPGIPGELRWSNPPLDWSVKDGALVVTAGKKTDLFLDPRGEYVEDSSPKALFAPDEHFLLSSHTKVGFASTYDAGVLIVYGRGDQWAKLCFEQSPSGEPMIVSVVNKGVSDDSNSVPVEGNRVFLRVAGLGEGVFAFHYSLDGQYWHLVRYFSLEQKQGLRVGFSTQSPTGESCRSVFSEIRYEKRKLEDLRNGQ